MGDRILQSKGGKRNDAVICYLAGGALDKIANVWLKELPDYETELLNLKTEDVTSPSDARLQALTNFVEKLATYRYITKSTGEVTGPMVEHLSKPILEFVNLVAGTGDFELASKFLQLLPSEFAGTEKERILKAASKDVKPATNVRSATNKSSVSGAAVRTHTRVPPVTAEPRKSYSAAPVASVPTSGYTPAIPQQQQQPQPQQPFGYQPPVAGYGAPSYAAPKSNPYARSNPYAPSNNGFSAQSPVPPQANLIGTVPVANASVIPPPPPPKASHKQETDGWNDLPDTFKPKATAPKRAAAAAAAASQSASVSLFRCQLHQVSYKVSDLLILLVVLQREPSLLQTLLLHQKVLLVVVFHQRILSALCHHLQNQLSQVDTLHHLLQVKHYNLQQLVVVVPLLIHLQEFQRIHMHQVVMNNLLQKSHMHLLQVHS